jgi:phosphoserine phosphatase RsbU/P
MRVRIRVHQRKSAAKGFAFLRASVVGGRITGQIPESPARIAHLLLKEKTFMSLAARDFSYPQAPHSEKVHSLLRLNRVAQEINSILDLDVLLDKLANEVVGDFGCVEAFVYLKEGDELLAAAAHGCTSTFKGDRVPLGNGVISRTARSGRMHYLPDVDADPTYTRCEPQINSELNIPLIAHGEVIGVFVAAHPDHDGFPPEQIELLEALAAHMAVAIYNATVFKKERAEKDEARVIQQTLFPRTSPQIQGFRIHGHCLPAGAVGGDWYDWISLPQNRWGLVLADVSGKGMAAALLMSATRGILRSIAYASFSPANVLQRLNELVVPDLPPSKFITMVYAVLDPAGGTLTFANAGHPWPMFVNSQVKFLQTNSGLPLGIGPGSYDEHKVELKPGSGIMLYSDGIVEASNQSAEEYGLERLVAHTQRRHDCTGRCVLEEVRQFAGTDTLADDATIILVRAE